MQSLNWERFRSSLCGFAVLLTIACYAAGQVHVGASGCDRTARDGGACRAVRVRPATKMRSRLVLSASGRTCACRRDAISGRALKEHLLAPACT